MPVTDTKKSADLDTRIADAFAVDMSAQQLSELLAEVKTAGEAAIVSQAQAKEVALNPATRTDALKAARKEMEDASFASERMEVAGKQLSVLLDKAKNKEAAAARAVEYKAAKTERDQLVKDLAGYREHAAAIATLLNRLIMSNARLAKANVGLSAEEYLYSAQDIARRSQHPFGVHHDTMHPDLISGVMLPKFFRENTSLHAMTWPPASTY